MSNSVDNVSAGKPKVGGAVSIAPLGSTLPTTADAVLAAAFKGAGYISEDGVTHTSSPESEEVKAWGGDTVLTPQTGKTDIYKMKFIEVMNVDVLKAIYGGENVSGVISTGLAITGNSKELDAHAWVIDQVLKGNVLYRTVIPNGKITEIGDVVYKDNEAIGFEVTITALPDNTGNTHYEYMKKGPEGATGSTGA